MEARDHDLLELLIDCEEDQTLRAVVFGFLADGAAVTRLR
jgi:hypothetical protein